MKKIFIIVGIFILAIMSGIFVINISEADTEVTEKATKVGVILNGEIDDGSWSQSHYEGLEKTAEQLNLAITYKEKVTYPRSPKLMFSFFKKKLISRQRKLKSKNPSVIHSYFP